LAKNKILWIPSQSKVKKQKATDKQKDILTAFFEPLILQYKKELQKVKPNEKFNYVTDIYTTWYRTIFISVKNIEPYLKTGFQMNSILNLFV